MAEILELRVEQLVSTKLFITLRPNLLIR